MKEHKYEIIMTAILLIVLLFITIGYCIETETTDNTVETEQTIETEKKGEIITVTDKWIKRTNKQDIYMIGTEDEVFKIQDNIFIFKFNSSDIYNSIKIGHKYEITTTRS